MKKIIISAILMILTLTISACSSSENKTAEYKKISPEKVKQMIDSKQEMIILDVRTQEEFLESRINNAILIPDYEIKEKAEKILTDKNATIIVYCRSGRRSKTAAKELLNMGYTEVHDMGGIIDWPFETINN